MRSAKGSLLRSRKLFKILLQSRTFEWFQLVLSGNSEIHRVVKHLGRAYKICIPYLLSILAISILAICNCKNLALTNHIQIPTAHLSCKISYVS